MAQLDIAEKRLPQDGRITLRVAGKPIDVRVSTIPTGHGERVVLRLLDKQAGRLDLARLGMDDATLAHMDRLVREPHGIVLITGPTGSGKTTTLYAALSRLDATALNIMTVEDPIEYDLDGISQTQINTRIEMSFARALRTILRQDPDIIMVGAIRDKETAALAIHAALTGHLVLSTLHTNNAIGVIPRLVDMGVDPFLIPPTLIMAIGQRLVRKLCPDSRKPVKIAGKIKEALDAELGEMPAEVRKAAEAASGSEIYQALASSICPKGTRGRTGIFEVLTMTPDLEKIILTGPSESLIREEAKKQGMLAMRQDGAIKVLKGIIGFEELREVI
jgi:general secretion pathway protein E